MASLIAYGSSSTYGVNDPEGGGWADRVRRTMIGRAEERSRAIARGCDASAKRIARVHNHARSNRTLPDIVASLPYDIAHRDGPGRLIIAAMIGSPDHTIPEEEDMPLVPLSHFRKELCDFSAICLDSDVSIIRLFVEVTPLDLSRPHPFNRGDLNPERLAEYQEAVRQHATITEAHFIDTHDAFLNASSDPISWDGIHPSPVGSAVVHDLVLQRIDAILS